MLINPDNFLYVAHWSADDRILAAKIAFIRAKRYQKWLGMKDAISDTLVGVYTAYRRYGDDFVPKNAEGYIRTELRSSSRKKQKFVNVTEVAKEMKRSSLDEEVKNSGKQPKKPRLGGSLGITTADDPRNSLNYVDLLRDIEQILTKKEYEVVYRHIILDQKITKYEKDIYRTSLIKIRDVLYV